MGVDAAENDGVETGGVENDSVENGGVENDVFVCITWMTSRSSIEQFMYIITNQERPSR